MTIEPYAVRPGQSCPSAPVHRRVVALGGLALALGVTNVVAAPRLGRVPSMAWNLGTTGALLALGRWAGADRAAIGLDRRQLARGLATGAAGAAVVAGLFGAATATARGRDLLDDDRVVDATGWQTALHVGVFIPFGTVVLEEVAFRGVLPALLDPEVRTVSATLVLPSLAFGAWHILSSRDFVAAHDPTGGGATGSTRGIVVGTTAAGLVLGLARRHGGHLVAPGLMHLSTNALTTLLGRAVGRRQRRSECRRQSP